MKLETNDNWRLGVRRMLEIEEGAFTVPYDDKTGQRLHATGNVTIGCGRNTDAKPLKPDEIIYLLDNDIDDAVEDCKAVLGEFVYRSLGEIHQYAVLNIAFNLGRSRFASFKQLREALHARDFRQAAAEVLDSLWAKQLPARAKRVADMFLTEEYPPFYVYGK